MYAADFVCAHSVEHCGIAAYFRNAAMIVVCVRNRDDVCIDVGHLIAYV